MKALRVSMEEQRQRQEDDTQKGATTTEQTSGEQSTLGATTEDSMLMNAMQSLNVRVILYQFFSPFILK